MERMKVIFFKSVLFGLIFKREVK